MLVENRNLSHNSNFAQKFKLWSKNQTLVKESNFGQNSNFGQKLKFWSKILTLVKKSNFGQKCKLLSKNPIKISTKNFGSTKSLLPRSAKIYYKPV